MDAEGRMTTQDGLPVQTDAGELIVNPELGPITVAQDGTITQDGEIVGRLSVVRFDDLSVLEKTGDNLYRNTTNLQPIEAADARVRQGMLEGSNVNTLIEITNLVEINRAYERITRMIENTNDLSRRAVERLGKVS